VKSGLFLFCAFTSAVFPASLVVAQDSPEKSASVTDHASQPAAGPADEPAAPHTEISPWEFRLAPYFWVPGMKGTTGVGGNNVNVDVSNSDAFDLLSDLKFGLMLHGEAVHGDLTLFGDATYMNLEQDNQNDPNRNLDLQIEQGIIELGATYCILDTSPPTHHNGGGAVRFRVEPLAGARFWYTSTSLKLPNIGFEDTVTETWVDAFGGARGALMIGDAWIFSGRLDFGAGMSEFTWQAIASAGYRVSSWGTVLLGWRWLSVDYNSGSGSDQFVYDLVLQGPFVAFTFNF